MVATLVLSISIIDWLDKLQLAGCKNHHLQKQPAMFPPLDIGLPVHSFLVADRYVLDLEI
jgi:hypothetical protein